MNAQLTNRQLQVLTMIHSFIKHFEYPPTKKEVSDFFGFRSVNSAVDHIHAIERKGCLAITRNVSRGTRLTRSGIKAVKSETVMIEEYRSRLAAS